MKRRATPPPPSAEEPAFSLTPSGEAHHSQISSEGASAEKPRSSLADTFTDAITWPCWEQRPCHFHIRPVVYCFCAVTRADTHADQGATGTGTPGTLFFPLLHETEGER